MTDAQGTRGNEATMLWSDERIIGNISTKPRLMLTIMRRMRDDYEAALAAQAAEHAEYKSAWLAMVREIANLDEVINPDDAMGQADDDTLQEQFDPWQTLREVRSQLAERSEWTDVEYNDIINVDNSVQLRVVIDQSEKPDGKVHIHVRKRIVGEWAHVAVTTLKPEWRIQRRVQSEDENG